MLEAAAGLNHTMSHATAADARIREHNGQQDKIRHYQDRYAGAGHQSQLLDHGNVDDTKRQESHTVAYQCHKTGLTEPYKSLSRCSLVVCAIADVVREAINDLDRVADPHGENQKRHQHTIRVYPQSQGMQQTQLPDHRHCGAQQRAQGKPLATAVRVQHDGRDHKGNAKERPHQRSTVNKIADQLGEACDMHLYGVAFILLPHQCFKVSRQRLVVKAFAGFGIDLDQWCQNGCGLKVVCYQPANLPGFQRVGAQLAQGPRRGIVVIRNDGAANKALLRDFLPAHVGRPQAL